MKILGIDHIVITGGNIEASISWYRDVLKMEVRKNGGRYEALFGTQKINFHAHPGEFQPAALRPASGCIDLCLEIGGPLAAALEELASKGIDLVEGPVARQGARGFMNSIYIRDPDGNLIELCVYQ